MRYDGVDLSLVEDASILHVYALVEEEEHFGRGLMDRAEDRTVLGRHFLEQGDEIERGKRVQPRSGLVEK
jgi:hypothetical protein